MAKPQISIIVAVSKNRAIGKANRLLFDLPDDLKRFKKITKNHTVVMGQKTFESIGRPLPDRTNIVITDNMNYRAPGAIMVHSIEEAIKKASSLSPLLSKEGSGEVEKSSTAPQPPPWKGGEEKNEIFIIGGGQIYRQFLPLADKLYLTIVDSEADGDTFFPDWRRDFTKEVFREERKDPKTGLRYAWIDLERKKR